MVKIIALALLLIGCGVSRYSANTKATYEITTPDGITHKFFYDSETEKKLVLKLVKQDDKITALEFSLESGTSEGALVAAANANAKWADIWDKVLPTLLKAGAMAGS